MSIISSPENIKRNMRFRIFAYRIANFFCMTPWYDFEKEELQNRFLNKIYAIIWGVSLTALLATATMTSDDQRNQGNIFENILEICNEAISFCLVVIGVFVSTFSKELQWTLFLKRFTNAIKFSGSCIESNIITSFYFQFVLGHVIYMCSILYHAYAWLSLYERKFILKFLSDAIPEYYYLLTVIVAGHLAIVLGCIYEYLNKQLEIYSYEGQTENNFVKNILEIGKTYRGMLELVKYHDNIFGWGTIMIFSHTIIQLLRSVNVFLRTRDDPNFSWRIFASLVIGSTVSMGECVYIILCYQSTTSIAKEMTQLCYRLQENFAVDSRARKELFNLADIAKSYRPTFTAANFFIINKGTTFSIINIATTYLIVLIQFNTTMQQK